MPSFRRFPARESRSFLKLQNSACRAPPCLKQYWRGPTGGGGLQPGVGHIRYLFKAARHGRFATRSPLVLDGRVRASVCVRVGHTRTRMCVRAVIDIGTAKSLALSTPNSKC